jgi:hypothetical protein
MMDYSCDSLWPAVRVCSVVPLHVEAWIAHGPDCRLVREEAGARRAHRPVAAAVSAGVGPQLGMALRPALGPHQGGRQGSLRTGRDLPQALAGHPTRELPFRSAVRSSASHMESRSAAVKACAVHYLRHTSCFSLCY